MTSVPLMSSKSATTVFGDLTITFPLVPVGRTWQGSVSVPTAPPGAQISVAVGGITLGLMYAPGPFGPLQLLSGQSLSLTATGLPPGATYTAILSGIDEPSGSASPYFGPVPLPLTSFKSPEFTYTPSPVLLALSFSPATGQLFGDTVSGTVSVPDNASVQLVLANTAAAASQFEVAGNSTGTIYVQGSLGAGAQGVYRVEVESPDTELVVTSPGATANTLTWAAPFPSIIGEQVIVTEPSLDTVNFVYDITVSQSLTGYLVFPGGRQVETVDLSQSPTWYYGSAAMYNIGIPGLIMFGPNLGTMWHFLSVNAQAPLS